MKIMLRVAALLVATVVPAAAQTALPFFPKDATVLFQGDSITDGGRQRVGNDYNHTMGQDYAYILSAEVGAHYPERNLTFINRGISGNRVFDLIPRWQTDVLDLKPDLVSILIGINDTLLGGDRSETIEQYETGYDKLLADTLKSLPGVKIILGEPFLLPVGKHKATYAQEMIEVRKRQAVVKKLAEKYKLPLIPYQRAFDREMEKTPADHWSWDGVHPTYAGHGLMAEEWIKAANAAWPKG